MNYEIKSKDNGVNIILISVGQSYCPKITWFIEDCRVLDLSDWEDLLERMRGNDNKKNKMTDQHGGSGWEIEIDQTYFKLIFFIGTGCGFVEIENQLMVEDMKPIIEKIIEIRKLHN